MAFGGRRVDRRHDACDAVGGESALLGVFPDHLLVGRDVDTVDLVVGYKTLNPLDLWTEPVQHIAGFLRDSVQFVRRQVACSRDFTFYDELRHLEFSMNQIF